MNSYLDTIRQLQTELSARDILQKVSSYSTYEDYLHGRHRKKQEKKIAKPTNSKVVHRQAEPTYTQAPQSNIKYFPVQRTEIEYKTNARIERVPKVVKKVEYVQKRSVELVPREVTVTDYYAVEHLRQYVKQVVPEKKIQSVAKEIVVKRYEDVPIQRQIIFYPDHIADIEEAKKMAREHLREKGVAISPHAVYRPMNEKQSSRIQFTSKYEAKKESEVPVVKVSAPISRIVESKSALFMEEKNEKTSTPQIEEAVSAYVPPPTAIHSQTPQKQKSQPPLNDPYYQQFKKYSVGDSYSRSIKKTDINSVPVYEKEKYELKGCEAFNSRYIKPSSGTLDYTFSQQAHQQKYNSATYNIRK